MSTTGLLAAAPSALDTIRDAAAAVADFVDPPRPPSPQERAVDNYVRVVRHATTWKQPPTIYGSSTSYFKRHFGELDPAKAHRMPAANAQAWMSVSDVVLSGPLVAGRRILVSGNLRGDPSVVSHAGGRTLSWAFALGEPGVSRMELLCRVPLEGPTDFAHGDRVTVAGVVMGDGAIERVDGRGVSRLSYMACSSAAHSTTVSLVGSRRRKKPRSG